MSHDDGGHGHHEGDDGHHEHDHGHGHGGDDHANDHDGHGHGHDHHHHHDVAQVGVAVLTVSSSRTLDEDPSGEAIEAMIGAEEGTELATRELVGDDPGAIGDAVDGFLADDRVDAVVTTGGTGITPDDVTIETVEDRFEKELPGFGETFRRRSESEVGLMIVGTRATAGVAEGTVLFALPGSENAARTGTEIVLGVVGHLAGLASR